jgi:hypothetical protein
MVNAGLGHLLAPRELLIATALLVSTAAILCLMRPLPGFALVVSELLAVGFLVTGWSYVQVWPQHSQLSAIIKLTAFMMSLGITWLMVLQLKTVLQVTDDVEKLLIQLKKYEEDGKVLTFNEFVYRAEAMFVAMRRRSESGFLVRISLDPGNQPFALRTLYQALSQAALMATRSKYDLVGKVSEYELVLMLQNTNHEGTAIVLNRVKKKLSEVINEPPNMYTVEVKPLPSTWAKAQLMITEWVSIKRRERMAL